MPRSRAEVSRGNRDLIVALRQQGGSWVSIERQTGVERRVAKRVYDESLRDDRGVDARAARQSLLREQLNLHIDDMMRLAQKLTRKLDVPLVDDELSSDEVVEELLRTHGPGEHGSASSRSTGDEPQARRHRNVILMASLLAHTQSQLDWSAIDRCKVARDRVLMQREALALAVRGSMHHCSQWNPAFPHDPAERGLVVRRLSQGFLALLLVSLRGMLSGPPRIVRGQAPLTLQVLSHIRYEVDESHLYVDFDELDTCVLSVGEVTDADPAHMVRSTLTCVANAIQATEPNGVLSEMEQAIHALEEEHARLAEMLDESTLKPLLLLTSCRFCPC